MIWDDFPRQLWAGGREMRQRPKGWLKPNPKVPLGQQVYEVMRFFHYSKRTEETYWQWIVRYLRFHRRPAKTNAPAAGGQWADRWRHPRELGAGEVKAYLSHLASESKS